MANTITYGSNKQVINITGIDTDWSWDDDADVKALSNNRGGLPIQSILFVPAATDDLVVLKDGDAITLKAKAMDAYSEKIKYFPKGAYTPLSLTVTDGSYSAAALIIIQLYPGAS